MARSGFSYVEVPYSFVGGGGSPSSPLWSQGPPRRRSPRSETRRIGRERSGEEGGRDGVVDLATANADRWIVQLDAPSIATQDSASGTKLDVNSAGNVS